MYNDFYHFSYAPFENTPDPRFFFASEQHREALAAIEYVIRMRKGYVLVTGDIGSGKTTVGRTVLGRCGRAARIVPVMHGHDSAVELLRQILGNLGAKTDPNEPRANLLARLHGRFQACAAQQQPVVLYVDEAQTLSDESLEELRLLSNFDTETNKLAQVVLIGQPELRFRISSPRFTALRQRIVLAKQLQPLSQADTRAYIDHRLRVATNEGEKPGVTFSPGAVRAIYMQSGGTPRLINFICDNCLLIGLVNQARTISVEMVQRVLADMMPTFNESQASLPSLSLSGSV